MDDDISIYFLRWIKIAVPYLSYQPAVSIVPAPFVSMTVFAEPTFLFEVRCLTRPGARVEAAAARRQIDAAWSRG